MRIKVELHHDVVWYVRHRCTAEEVDAFYKELDVVRNDPIHNSEPIEDPTLSRYLLRFFRFKGNIAIFKYNPAKDRIRVLECRRARPQPGAKPGRRDQ